MENLNCERSGTKELEVFGPIHVRYQRKAGRAEKSAGYTEDGTQITEFDFGLIEKQELLPWEKEAIEQATGFIG